MRPLYKFKAEGVWFSRNGTAAYKRGEKPLCLWPKGSDLTPTVAHHIARHRGGGNYSRELVMFYRHNTEIAHPCQGRSGSANDDR